MNFNFFCAFCELSSGETSSRKSMEQDYRKRESTLPTSKPAVSSSTRRTTMEAGDQRRKESYSQLNVVEAEAEAWERAQLDKVKKR